MPPSKPRSEAPTGAGKSPVTVKAVWRLLIHGSNGDLPDNRSRRILRWIRIAILLLIVLVTLQSVLLVAGAWRDDLAIQRNMGVAPAEVLSAGPRRSTIEFVTPDRVTYRPELGVLYPSELSAGMRIYVEYDKNNPNLVRVQNRNAELAIIPAGSIAVLGWLMGGALLLGIAVLEKRLRTADFRRRMPDGNLDDKLR